MILWIIILFLAGVALIVAEFFVPGLICGVIGTLCLLGGCTLGMYHYPEYAFFIVLLYALGGLGAIFGGVLLLPRTRAGRAMVLHGSIAGEPDWVSDVSDQSLIDKEGVAFTKLRPAGTVMVGERRLNAVSNGEFIEQDSVVRIIEVHGNRVVVEQIDDSGQRVKG